MAWLNAKRLWTYGLLCVLVVWLIAKAPDSESIVAVPADKVLSVAQFSTIGPVPGAVLPRLPVQLDRPLFEPAFRDPFAVVVAAPSRSSVPVPTPAIAATPTAPLPTVTPVPPPLGLIYVGRTVLADQSETVYVSYGQTDFALKVGDRLPNGYVVDAIGQRTIEFIYPPLKTMAQLDLPLAPKFQTR